MASLFCCSFSESVNIRERHERTVNSGLRQWFFKHFR